MFIKENEGHTIMQTMFAWISHHSLWMTKEKEFCANQPHLQVNNYLLVSALKFYVLILKNVFEARIAGFSMVY